jgi:hypothetical protein
MQLGRLPNLSSWNFSIYLRSALSAATRSGHPARFFRVPTRPLVVRATEMDI